MTERTQAKYVKQMKTLIPLVEKYQTTNGFDNFDFGYMIVDKVWVADFFDTKANIAESFVFKTYDDFKNKFTTK